jgi:hypothetical protein
MPNIRVMQWNIRTFGPGVTAVPGMLNALSRIIRGANPDIVILLELAKNQGGQALGQLCNQLRWDNPANHWRGMVSYPTGRERYGFICRDLNLVRPLQATATANDQVGDQANPVRNVETLQFTTWPVNWPTAVPVPLVPPIPGLNQHPLLGVFYHDAYDRPGKRQRNASGQPLRYGGYNLGEGGRMPCLVIFRIHTAAGNDCYLPIVVNHYWAARSSHATNAGALDQINETRLLHIAQKFVRGLSGGATTCGYVDIDNAAVPVRELMFTGDWNIDFRLNSNLGNAPARNNRSALNTLTPTQQNAGSAPIPLAPPPAGGHYPTAAQGPGAVPAGPPPAVPFNPPEDSRVGDYINRQYLTSAITTQGTILLRLTPAAAFQQSVAIINAAANFWELRRVAFDLTFFAGTRLNTAALLTPVGHTFPASPADAGEVIDVPASIDPMGAAPALLSHFHAGPIQQHYAIAPVRFKANLAPNLNVAGAALNLQHRWIGAQMISDHVPTVVQFFVP